MSAVDPDVAGKLYERCIEGFLQDKCVILVTHQVQHLKNVENILVLDDGKIKMRGSYNELKEQGLDFDEILKKYQGTKKTEKEDDIFDDEESDIEDEKVDELNDTKGNNYSDMQRLTLPPIKGTETSNNDHDQDESREPINASAKVLPIQETDNELIDTKDKSKEVKIIVDEDKDEGNVPLSIWCSFFNYGLGFIGIFLILVLSIILGFFNVIINYIVAIWTEKDKEDQQDPIYFNLFWITIVIIIVVTTVRTAVIYLCFLLSSTNIHKKMTWKLLRAPSSFFDANPIGRILTRYAKDTVILDYFACFIFGIALATAIKIFAIYIMIIISVPWMSITSVINFVFVYFMRKR